MINDDWLKDIVRWQEVDKHPLSIHPSEQKIKKSTKRQVNDKRFYLVPNYSHIYFTEREMEVSKYLLDLLTYNVISKKIGVSCRSIESYVRDMKQKLGCSSKNKLIAVLKTIKTIREYRNKRFY